MPQTRGPRRVPKHQRGVKSLSPRLVRSCGPAPSIQWRCENSQVHYRLWLPLPSPTSTKRTRASVNICRANKIGQLCISASCKYAAPAADLRPLEDPLPGKSARQGLQIWTENILYSHASCLAKIFTGLAWFENLNGFEHLHGSFTSRGCSHKVARPKAAFAKHVHWILWLQRSMDPWTYELFLHPFLSSMLHFLPLFLGIGRFQRVSLCLGSLWKIYVNNPRIHGCYNPSIQPSSHPVQLRMHRWVHWEFMFTY